MANAQILVVEDEGIVAKNIQHELENMGYTVPAIASSGEEALQLATETLPDLVLMDVVLKGNMDGVEATEEIRDRLDIPVVYLTAYADEQTLRRAKITGPYGYLLKPYEEEELHTTIELALFNHEMAGISQEMRRWYAAIFRSMAEAVIVTDADGYIRMTNQLAQTLTGWLEDEAFGKRVPEVFHIVDEHTRALRANPAAQAQQRGLPVRLEKGSILIGKYGREIPIDGSASPICEENGAMRGVVLVFREITERKPEQQSVVSIGGTN